MRDCHIETSCVQGGYTPGNGQPRQIPIIQSKVGGQAVLGRQ